MARHGARRRALVLVAGLALALASGLTACSSSADDSAPSGATESPAPSAVPLEPPPAAPSPTPDPSAEVPVPRSAPPPLLYDTYDLSGAVTGPGHHAFLADPDDPTSVVTTYEELRDGTATALLIHTRDAHGISRTDLYDAIEPGDLFEWHQAADCFVRYQVTAVKPDPTGTVPQKLLAVAWMTYAFAGCSGTIAPDTAATLDWSALPDLGGTSLTTPIVHGSFQLAPEEWEGTLEDYEVRPPPEATVAAIDAIHATWTAPARTVERAQELPYWRTPELPSDWRFLGAGISNDIDPYGYVATWRSPTGSGLDIDGTHAGTRWWPQAAVHRFPNGEVVVRETRVIAGRPAFVDYMTVAVAYDPIVAIIYLYDPATDGEYRILVDRNTTFPDLDAAIALVASLFAHPNAP